MIRYGTVCGPRAPVAQLDRASDFGSEGWGFESLRARQFFVAASVVLLALRGIALLRYRFNSDEAQHLHVVWAWTEGLVPYRDVFDNHTPLFHVAMAPMLAALGERADILLWMRGLMLPLFAVVVLCTYVLGKRLYSHRVGLWSALLIAAFPPFFLTSLEFRSDNLWTAIWMTILVTVAGRTYTARRAFVTGLLLGIALATSVKTVALIIALFAATTLRRLLQRDDAEVLRPMLATLAGLAIVPATIIAWFATRDALDELLYFTLTFNSALAGTSRNIWRGLILLPLLTGVAMAIARRYRNALAARLFCALVIGFYLIAVSSFWILISPRDLLPVMPVAAIFAVAAIDRMRFRVPVLAAVVVVNLIALYDYADRFQNRTDEHMTMMHQVLGLTRPGEPIMDLKGETIYRPRPFYYAFETLTRAQMRAGLIRDTVPEAIVKTRCYVTQADGPLFPPRANAFIHDNFLDVGRLRVAGQFVRPDGTFTIVVPGRYVAITQRGAVAAPRELPAGTHRFERTERVAILWAPAFERGYSPFHLRDRDF
jgi:hypothetical protein